MKTPNTLLRSAVTTIALTAVAFLAGCSSIEVSSYVDDYQAHQQQAALSSVDTATANRFVQLFSNLHADNLEEQVANTYASDIYFNDTLNTVNTREEMLAYLQHTAEMLDTYTLTVKDIVVSEDNLYVRWVMDLEFTAAGKDIKSQSIGMSHLKFNDDGQIILHQDYWDSVDAIYQHLPYVGGLFRRVRDRL